MSETQFQRLVTDTAQWLGWRVNFHRPTAEVRKGGVVHHTTATTVSGMPDLEMWRPGRYLRAELKTDKGRLSAVQTEVIESLRAAGVTVYVWRPRDWPEIEAILRGRRADGA